MIPKKVKPRLSKLSIVTLVLVLLFSGLIIAQWSCSGSGKGNNGSDSASKPPTAGSGSGITPAISGNVPTEVNIPNPDSNAVNNRPAFDVFSWQTFIALCWPVDTAKRGVPLTPDDPNTMLKMTNSTPVVWTSYKNQWDLFGQGNNTPSAWNSWADPVNLCTNQPVKHVFGSAKSDMLPGEGNESLSVPLIDQRKNYALYEIRYNEVQYNFIVNNSLYFSKNLYNYQKANGGAVTMPISNKTTQGSILIKAAWKHITPQDDPSRYYIINEIVYDPVTKKCTKEMMGLVGLHIAQKVDQFGEWVWSSFEQVDNVPGAANAKAPYTFNNGTNVPSTTNHGFANKPTSKVLNPDSASRVPVQVVRLNEIPTTPSVNNTVDINKIYQAALSGTWLKYYQLVITQWPSNAGQFKQFTQNGIYPADCGGAFPVNNCVNVTMETYFQNMNDAAGAGGNSCMSCHYQAPNTDFSWSLQLRSH
ncbi:MAG: hypothetical protein V4577_28640 [Bacteroidota bacterium]